MKRVSLLSLLLVLLSLPAAAQTPAPVITSIEPAAGSVAGGALVTIAGTNLSLPANFACVLPCPTMVRFGSVEVSAIDESNTSVTVRTPAHAAGTVDVTLRTGDGRQTVREDGFTFVPNGEAGYATLLLPVYSDGDVPGAAGSLWRTEFWIRNNGKSDVLLAPWECPFNSACPAVFPQTKTLLVNENHKNLPVYFRAPNGNPGHLLFVTRAAADDVATSLRLWDVSREADDAGTELPVVREKDFKTTTAHLMSVPLNGRFRLMLRVYDVANSEARFRVRVYGQEAGTASELLTEVELTATTPDPGPFRVQPAYAQHAGIESLLLNPVPRPSNLRIEVEPLTPGSIFWTFVAVTNNDTQRVTLVTPQ